MEPSRCWGCGAIPQEGGAQLQACSLCRSEGLPPCFFCSEQCLRAAWPHHREWHREQERLHGLALQMAARHWSLGAAAPCSAYDELLSAMGAMGAMSGQCDHPSSVNVGSAGSGDVALAVATFLLAAEQHTDPASLGWSERCIAAYALRSQPDCLASGAPAAPWWTDVQLVSLSARVVGARPDLPLAWRMRGEVLSGRLGRASWRVGPRSPEELEEAGHALQACTPSAPSAYHVRTDSAQSAPSTLPVRALCTGCAPSPPPPCAACSHAGAARAGRGRQGDARPAGAHVLPRRADDARRGLSRTRAFRLCTCSTFNGRSTACRLRGRRAEILIRTHVVAILVL